MRESFLNLLGIPSESGQGFKVIKEQVVAVTGALRLVTKQLKLSEKHYPLLHCRRIGHVCQKELQLAVESDICQEDLRNHERETRAS